MQIQDRNVRHRTKIKVAEVNRWASDKWMQVQMQVVRAGKIRNALQDIVTYAKLEFCEKLMTKHKGLIRLNQIQDDPEYVTLMDKQRCEPQMGWWTAENDMRATENK